MRKRLLAGWMMALALCLLAAFAAAESGWQWTLMPDGTVKITGYAGEETELSVPQTLDGHPVTALGDGALAGATQLRTLTVPRRVREIGENVLGGNAVQVRGWNGSFAQQWAASQGLGFENLSFYHLFEGVVDLSGTDPQVSESGITLDAADAADLAAGDLIVFSGADVTDLRAFTVTGVRLSGSKAVLSVLAEEPLSAVESYRIEWDDVELENSDARTLRSNNTTVPRNGEAETSVSYNVDGRSVSVTHSRKTRVSGYYDYKFSQKQEGYIQIVTEDTVTQKTEGVASLKDITGNARTLVKSMQAVKAGGNAVSTGVGSVEGVKAFGSIGAKSKIDLSAAAVGKTKYTLRTTQIVRIDGEEVEVVREIVDEDEDPEMEMSGSISLDMSASVGVDLKLGSSLKIGSSGSLALKVEAAPQYDAEVKCYDARVEYSYGFGVTGKLGVSTPTHEVAGSASVTFKKIDAPIGPQISYASEPVFHLEIREKPSNGHGTVEKMQYCSVLPADQYVIHFHTGTHTKIEDIYGKAGNTIKEPEKKPASATGTVKFLNWSTDPLDNVPYDFSQPLPEVDLTQRDPWDDSPNELDLWAAWSLPYRELTIDLNDGETEPVLIHLLPGEYVESKDRPVVPLRQFYRFDGWKAQGVSEGNVWTNDWDFLGSPMPDMDITVTAQWKFDAGYDPVKAAEEQLEEDEELRERMIGEFKRRSHFSTDMQALGAHSHFDNWRVLNMGLVWITGYTGDSPVVVIPETINGSPVVYVDGSGWENKASLQALVLPPTACYVTGFKDFPNLRRVQFREEERIFTGALDVELHFVGTETIADNCFMNCSKLETINFPKYLHSIGGGAFMGTAIKSAPLAQTKCVSIGGSAFEKCLQLESVSLPAGVTRLGDMVFAYCESLNQINLENVIDYAFGCLADTAFTELELLNVYRLADDIVTECRNLKRLKIEMNENSTYTNAVEISRVRQLEEIELVGCALQVSTVPKLESYQIDGFVYDKNRADFFGLTKGEIPNLKTFVIKNSKPGSLTIEDCPRLETLDLTNTELDYMTDYSDSVVSHGGKLGLFHLPALKNLIYHTETGKWVELYLSDTGLTSLDLSDFYVYYLSVYDCPNLKTFRLSEVPGALLQETRVTLIRTGIEELILPAGLEKISLNVQHNPQLKKVMMPNSLISLKGGFQNNPNLREVRLPENTEIRIPDGSFSGSGPLELRIPACWTADQLKMGLLSGSQVSCLKVDGSADVSNLKVKDELFVAETAEGSAAWTALEEKGFLLRPEGEAWRAARFRYLCGTTVLNMNSFDHPDKIGDGLVRTAPGASLPMPAVALEKSSGKDYTVIAYTVGGVEVTDPTIAPEGDFTVTAQCFKNPDVTYEVTEGGVRLTGITVTTNATALYIPEAVNGYPVVEVAPAVYTAAAFTDIYLPSTLLRVSGRDFAECTALKAVHGTGKTWTTEEGRLYAMDGAGVKTGLILCPRGYEGVLALPDSVKELGSFSINELAGLTGLEANGLEVIQPNAVVGHNGLTALVFPESLTEIRGANFRDSSLESVTFGSDPVLANDAFISGSMIDFYGPEAAPNLIAWAERNDQRYNLYALTLAVGGTESTLDVQAGSDLGAYAPISDETHVFLGWSENPRAENPELISRMPARALRVEAVWQGEPDPVPEEETDIWTRDFVMEEQADGSLMITRYTGKSGRPVIPAEVNGKPVTAIGEYAFAGNAHVGVIVVPVSVVTVGAHAFDTAIELTEITFEADEVAFGESVLANCDSLRTVRLPAAQLSLPARMFAGSGSLASPEIPDTVTTIGEGAFAGCEGLYTLTLPAGVEDFTPGMVWDAPLRAVRISEQNEHLAGDGTAVWTADGKTLLYVCPKAKEVQIPATVTKIGNDALRRCTALGIVTLPEGLTEIGERAFERSGLRELVLPESLRSIGNHAFRFCMRLDRIHIPDTVTEIGEEIFGAEDVLIYADSFDGVPYRVLSGTYHVLVQASQEEITAIRFAEEAITLKINETVRLQPLFEPEGAAEPRLSWSLGYNAWGDRVRLTREGEITGLNSGTQTVYAETPNGLKAEISVTVLNGYFQEPKAVSEIQFFRPVMLNGTVCLSADSRASLSAKMNDNTSWSISKDWCEISCPEYPGLFSVSPSASGYVVSRLPDGLEEADCTMVVEGSSEDVPAFRFEIPCKVFRKTFEIDSTLRLPESLSLFEGDSIPVRGFEPGLFDMPFSRAMGYGFTSSNPEVAEVDDAGRIQAKKPGAATIRIAGMTKNNTCVLLVRENKINLQASLTSERILKGKTEQITVSSDDGNVTFEYASEDESVVTVGEDGKVTYQGNGTTRISVLARKDGMVVAGRNWEVRSIIPYTSWAEPTLSEIPGVGKAKEFNLGDTLDLTRNYARNEAEASSYYVRPNASTVRWESEDEAIVSIDSDGVARALKPGVVTVRGTLEYSGESLEIKVCCDIWNVEVTWSSKGQIPLALGESKPLSFRLQPADDSLQVSAEADYGRVSVDENCVMTGVEPGYDQISLRVLNRYGSDVSSWGYQSVYVLEAGECSAIEGLPERVELFAGESLLLAGPDALRPAGASIGEDDTLSSDDESVARISLSGNTLELFAVSPGSTLIRIGLAHGETYKIPVRVKMPEVYGTTENAPAIVVRGRTVQLKAAELRPAATASASWSSSDPSVLKVTGDGKATGVKNGSAQLILTVTDSAGGTAYTEWKEVRVADALSGFKEKKDAMAVWNYGDYILELEAANAADDPADLAARTSVISARGYDYAVEYGDPDSWDGEDKKLLYLRCISYPKRYDRVTLVTDNGDTDRRVSFDLAYEDSNDLSLKNPVELVVNQKMDLADAIDSYRFSSVPTWTAGDSSLLRINGDGTATALKVGETTLTATAKDGDGEIKTAQTQVIIRGGAVTAIRQTEEKEMETLEEETYNYGYVYFNYSPASAALWAECADSGMLEIRLNAAVEESGDAEASGYISLRGLKQGSTVVTIRGESGEKLEIPVTVRPKLTVETNLVNQSSVPVGTQIQIRVIMTPDDPDAEIIYSSEDPSFTVDEGGLLTAVSAGSTRIHVKVSGKDEDQIYVMYAYDTVGMASISPAQARITPGETLKLAAVGTDGKTMPNYLISWSSSDPGIAEVSSGGAVTGIRKGTVTVTAAARDGLTKAEMTLTVYDDSLNTLKLPKALKAVEEEAFAGMKDIQCVILGNQVESVGRRAFADCPALIQVRISGESCAVDPTAFENCGPELVIYCPKNAPAWNTLVEAGFHVEAP